MGKSKSSKSGKSSKSSTAKTPECKCQDFYRCMCGNRPDRPSKGHKWDPLEQKWTGKGHKQKGAGTTAISRDPQITKEGGTKLEQWQKLPTKLLEDFCKKEKRPPFRLHPVDSNGGKELMYRYRIVVMDAKSTKRGHEHDLSFCPAKGAKNAEQAKEEAAILALLHLTPKIPHDRKLPEPYKTIFLNAIEHQRQQQNDQRSSVQNNSTLSIHNKTNSNVDHRSLNDNQDLVMDRKFVSLAEKKRYDQQRKVEQRAKIAKREALQEANKPHKVLMSQNIRKSIQLLLKSSSQPLDDVEDFEDLVYIENSVKNELEKRLLEDGFASKQTKMAISYLNIQQKIKHKKGEQLEELNVAVAYEKSLQWLCVHMDEKDLPERFNPKGKNLDVIANTTKNGNDCSIHPETIEIRKLLGMRKDEAVFIIQRAKEHNAHSSEKELLPIILVEFWNCICKVAKKEQMCDKSLKAFQSQASEIPKEVLESNLEQLNDEIEALQAIFADTCNIVHDNKEVGGLVQITIPLEVEENESTKSNSKPVLEIHLHNGYYPTYHPSKVFIKNAWTTTSQSAGFGTILHIKLIEFLASLSTDVPMVYEIFGFVTDLLEQKDDRMSSLTSPLLSYFEIGRTVKGNEKTTKNIRTIKKTKQNSTRRFRPRARSSFWSNLPRDTPPAVSFPTISKSMENARKSLPANAAREEFYEVLKKAQENNRVLLLTGETGCGKTTQIPQFILEKYPSESKIVIAQPRRLAATGVAGRVAAERGENTPGSKSVGYVVRGDTAMCDHTRLMFCTTGVLLRQLQVENALKCITHIVVDEVHERHLDSDILLGILKKALPNNPHLTIVLMSATMDADRFAAYWGKNTPRIHIPGFTYPVQDFNLKDVLSLTGYIPPKKGKKKSSAPFQNPADDDQTINSEPQTNLEDLVQRVQENIIDFKLIAALVKELVENKAYDDDGAILVFLPGAPEIGKAEQAIRRANRNARMLILPLHGGLQPKDQKLVFDKPNLGTTKVVLATNVAETSITIPDVTIVIDTCREKQSSYDPVNRMPMLVERFASRDSLKQRRGRAGRVRPGTCYKLISKKTLDKLAQHGEPEIRRCALDQTLLSLLFLGVENGSGSFLQHLLDPPSRKSIDAALFSLKKIGAIVKSAKANEFILTPLGMHLAGIPAPPPIGKLLVIGSLLGCRNAALIMAAGMTAPRSPFMKLDVFNNSKPRFNRQEESDEKNDEENLKKEMEEMKQQRIIEERSELLKKVGNSDYAMLAYAYIKWESLEGGKREKLNYCESLGLSPIGMREIKQLKNQLESSLNMIGFESTDEADMNANSWRIIRTCIVAALAPSQVVRVHRPVTKYSETVEGAIEKDGNARELKFFVRNEQESALDERFHSVPTKNSTRMNDKTEEQRVFMHPSSATFKVGNYSFPWLVYHSLVKTSKSFLRDATECNSYAILIFGGNIEIQAAKELIVIDEWIKLTANARIGALIGGLRERVDDLLAKKVANPRMDIRGSLEMKLIVDLIITDGLSN